MRRLIKLASEKAQSAGLLFLDLVAAFYTVGGPVMPLSKTTADIDAYFKSVEVAEHERDMLAREQARQNTMQVAGVDPHLADGEVRHHRFRVFSSRLPFRDQFFFYMSVRSQPCHKFYKGKEHPFEVQKHENTTVLIPQQRTSCVFQRWVD